MRRFIVYGVSLAVAIAVAAIGIDLLVVSDEESVGETVGKLRDAAESGDLTRALPLLDLDGNGFDLVVGSDRESYTALNADALEDRLVQGSEWLGGASVRFDTTTIVVEGNRAHAYARMRVERDGRETAATPVNVTLRRDNDRWVVTRIRALDSSLQARR